MNSNAERIGNVEPILFARPSEAPSSGALDRQVGWSIKWKGESNGPLHRRFNKTDPSRFVWLYRVFRAGGQIRRRMDTDDRGVQSDRIAKCNQARENQASC